MICLTTSINLIKFRILYISKLFELLLLQQYAHFGCFRWLLSREHFVNVLQVHIVLYCRHELRSNLFLNKFMPVNSIKKVVRLDVLHAVTTKPFTRLNKQQMSSITIKCALTFRLRSPVRRLTADSEKLGLISMS